MKSVCIFFPTPFDIKSIQMFICFAYFPFSSQSHIENSQANKIHPNSTFVKVKIMTQPPPLFSPSHSKKYVL